MSVNTVSLATALVDSNHRFKKDCLTMTITSIEEVTKHMRLITGLKGKETEATIVPQAHFRPYSSEKVVSGTGQLKARTLETFPLEILEEFDPEELYKTIFGTPVEADKINLDIVRRILTEEMKNACRGLCDIIFTGVKDDSTVTSSTPASACFNGFDTIIAAEKALATPTISYALGNFVTLGELSEYNIGDKWFLLYTLIDEKLRGDSSKKLKLVCTLKEKEMYNVWYANKFGHGNFAGVPDQMYLHGTNNKVEIVALPGMEGASHCFITTKENMKVGVNVAPEVAKFEVRRPDNPNVVQFHVVIYMGVDFANVDKEFLMTAARTVKSDAVYMLTDKSSVTFADTTLSQTKTAKVKIFGFNMTESTSLTLEGTDAAEFSLSDGTNTISSVTAANANASAGYEVTITFAPTTTAGARAAALRLTNATDNVSIVIPLAGKGVQS